MGISINMGTSVCLCASYYIICIIYILSKFLIGECVCHYRGVYGYHFD